MGWEGGGCGDGCGGGSMDWDACTGEGEDIMGCCCCTCRWTESRERAVTWFIHEGQVSSVYLLRHRRPHRHGRGGAGGGVGGGDGGVEGGAGHPGWKLHPRTDQLQRTKDRTGRRLRLVNTWSRTC